MDFKTFFIKKVMMSFYVTVTCITLAMAVIGLVFESDTRFGYEAFFSPLIFGAISSLPLLIKYSRTELSFRQTLVREGLHFILLEVLVLAVLYQSGVLTDVSMGIALGISILIINITVHLVLFINDKKTADEFNEALKVYQVSENPDPAE